MTITMEITKSVLMGCPGNANVTVMDLRAAADEMPFVQALTKFVKDFASTFDAAKEKEQTDLLAPNGARRNSEAR